MSKKLLPPLLAAALLCPVLVNADSTMSSASSATSAKSLYQRLGGYDALAAVSDDFIGRLAGDPSLGRFFQGHATSSLHHIRQLIVDQLCAATGGPCYYTGRDMKTAHAGLAITEADWDTTVKHLVATLDRFNVPPREKQEVLTAVSGFKPDIVSPKTAVRWGIPRGSDRHDDLPEVSTALEVFVRLARLLKREDAIDHGPELGACDGLVHRLEVPDAADVDGVHPEVPPALRCHLRVRPRSRQQPDDREMPTVADRGH